MFIVTVEFEIHDNHIEAFNEAMKHQADTSLNREPECHRFDVCRDTEAQNRIFLYEIYSDRAAFDKHLATDHFQQFDANVKDWVVNKKVGTWELIDKN